MTTQEKPVKIDGGLSSREFITEEWTVEDFEWLTKREYGDEAIYKCIKEAMRSTVVYLVASITYGLTDSDTDYIEMHTDRLQALNELWYDRQPQRLVDFLNGTNPPRNLLDDDGTPPTNYNMNNSHYWIHSIICATL